MAKKCVICGNLINADEETIPYKNRTAHLKCFDNMSKLAGTERSKRETPAKKRTQKPKATVELKEGLTEEEYQEKKSFFDYVRQLIGSSELSAILRFIPGLLIRAWKIRSDITLRLPGTQFRVIV